MSDAPGRTTWIEKGAGESILLIHGVGLRAEAWEAQIAALSDTNRVIAMNMLGHGGSAPPPPNASLDDYVDQAAQLLRELNIPAANVIGHSMGGLVAIGLALKHPAMVLRLGVLNSVYERGGEARAAVEARAASLGTMAADVENPLTRWFGEDETEARRKVRHWLKTVDPQGYAAAYRVFASSDRVFSSKLDGLAMPALFATASGDQNSSPAMAEAMATLAPRGKWLVIDGERHMMPMTAPGAVNHALRNLLAEPLKPFDTRELRSAFGSFMTGVTIVTTIDQNGNPRGFTANSFTSVSLNPPLLLICIGKNAASRDTFSASPGFVVNILSEKQKITSGIFASKRPDKFADVAWRQAPSGNPLIDGSVAWFDCTRHEVVDAGDHIIVLGAVRAFSHSDANPLGYARGGYVALGLEQAAVNAATGGHTIVGAILESEGQLILTRDQDGKTLRLPEVGRTGHSGSASLLHEYLRRNGIDTDLGFLFAVFENPQTKVQSIYYRGDATLRGDHSCALVPFDRIPWEQLPDEATRIMLKRYADERLQGRFKIYSGSHERGQVRHVEQ
ncbi:alpha/beta fold hydrolase [Aestuariivirga sp.]|uniref:alpha/beta fold hydrolase n=1 Tax=Aestuariivirga sp. TaxID=2650926 RepID=UPI0039E54359